MKFYSSVVCEGNFFHHRHYFANSDCVDVRKCFMNLVWHWNHSFIWISLGVCRKNKELYAKDILLTTDIISKVPTVGMWENKFLNLVFKFHDNPTVNKFEIAILVRLVWVYAKKDDFRRGRKENQIERKRKS